MNERRYFRRFSNRRTSGGRRGGGESEAATVRRTYVPSLVTYPRRFYRRYVYLSHRYQTRRRSWSEAKRRERERERERAGSFGVRPNDAGGRSLLVFHRFQSIKLVVVVLPSADHASAVPFLRSATISVRFSHSIRFPSSLSSFLRVSSSSRVALPTPSPCNPARSFSPYIFGKKFPALFTVLPAKKLDFHAKTGFRAVDSRLSLDPFAFVFPSISFFSFCRSRVDKYPEFIRILVGDKLKDDGASQRRLAMLKF